MYVPERVKNFIVSKSVQIIFDDDDDDLDNN